MLPSYRNQSIDLHTVNQLTGFYITTTLAFNGLNKTLILKGKKILGTSLTFASSTDQFTEKKKDMW